MPVEYLSVEQVAALVLGHYFTLVENVFRAVRHSPRTCATRTPKSSSALTWRVRPVHIQPRQLPWVSHHVQIRVTRPFSTTRLTAARRAVDLDPARRRAVEPDARRLRTRPPPRFAPASNGPHACGPVDTGARAAATSPPPSAMRTTSGASTSINSCNCPVRNASTRNRSTTACCSRPAHLHPAASRTCSRARRAICRTVTTDFPMASATWPYGDREDLAQHEHHPLHRPERLQHGQQRDRDALGEVRTSSATSGLVRSGSGSHAPT